MLDPKIIREEPKKVQKSFQDRKFSFDLEGLIAQDQSYRTALQQLDDLRHQKRKTSDEVGRIKREGGDVAKQLAQMKEVSDQEDALTRQVQELEVVVKDQLLRIPNIPHDSVPVGSPKANKEIRSWGKPRQFTFKPKDHLQLAESLQLIDFVRASKMSGSHFVLFTGMGARLERALIQFMLDLHTRKHGYTEVAPPYLVNRASMTGTGQLPKLEEDMYRLKDDDLFLIPTAEVPVTNMYAGEILEDKELPKKFTAYTACFRREAGSYGKDTKGLTRVHQFDKVELVKLVRPENSYEELEKLAQDAEEVLQLLELPYRIVALATEDLSFAAAKCYDFEVHSAGTGNWLEVSSCSNFEDFQARRANIRFRDPVTKKVTHLHTLNGSGVALARTVIALLECHQNEDGSVTIPEPLRPFLDGLEKLTPPD